MKLLSRIGLALMLLAMLAACAGAPAAQNPTAAPAEPTAAPAEPTAAPAAQAPKIVASTSWVAAFAKAAGATDITVIAPSNVQHPPDYDPKPSDLTAVSGADYVLLAGFEGFAARLQEAVGGDSSKLITVMTENSPEAIRGEVTRLGELFGTQEQAAAFLSNFDAEYSRLSGEVQAAVGDAQPVVVAQAFATPWVVFAGLEPAGTYGPMPLAPSELKQLADLKPSFVFENYHMGGGQPLVEATGAQQIDLLNFPGEDLDLLAVFATNAERITAAFSGAATPPAPAAASFPVTIENCGRSLTFDAPPERVVSLWQPPTEMLLALGVQDQIVALAGNYTDLRPDLAPAAANIKSIGTAMAWPSKEVLLSEQPDLVIAEGLEGFSYDSAQGYATVAEIEATGAQVISTGGSCTPMDPASQTKSTETVYNDLLMLGKVFGVSERAEALVAELQAREAAVVAKVADRDPVKVAFYNGGDGPVFVLSFGIWADLMQKAGGENVITTEGFQISNEEFAASQPEVILIGTYPGQEAEDRIAFLKATFPTIPAVQNDRLVPIPTIDTEASVRAIDGLEQIAKALHPEAFVTAALTGEAVPFDVRTAQFYLDTAGFHGMAETISTTKELDSAYLTRLNRVGKVLKQTIWPAELGAPATTFLTDLDAFTAALTVEDVAAATVAANAVHDSQHELSHEVDHWLEGAAAPTGEADVFRVSVAQYLLDSAGFHGMAETISTTKELDSAYLTTVTRVGKVLNSAVWPADASEPATAFLSSLAELQAALTADDVAAATTAANTVHDTQHELSHALDHWMEEGQALAPEADRFQVRVAQYLLDTAGFHGMAETISETKTLESVYLTTVTRTGKVFNSVTWPADAGEQATAFLSSLAELKAALTADDVAAATTAANTVHDTQHELSHAVEAWAGGGHGHDH